MKTIAWGCVVGIGLWTSVAGAQGGATATPRDGATYHVRLQDLQERVDELQEQLRRMQNRVKLAGRSDPAVLGSAHADITFADATTSAFVLTGVRVLVDDVVVYDRDDTTGALRGAPQVTAFRGGVAPGEHKVRVEVKLAGNGALLPYLRAYHFEVSDTRRVTATEDRPLALTLRVFERGDVTTPLEQRPAIAFEAGTR